MKRKIAIMCGGPSAERGISLNSARSLYDNLNKDKYDVSFVYFNPRLDPFVIPSSQIYSNTPLDFDYKLHREGKPLSQDELAAFLKNIDLVFPAIHGTFGEDGGLQTLLEKIGVAYLGSGPEACRNTSDKYACQRILGENGFYTIPSYVVKKGENLPELTEGKYVMKPLHGGSSIGVHYFEVPYEMQAMKEKMDIVFSHEDEAIVEPFFEGKEFTIIVLENAKGEAIPILPTEVEFHSDDRFFSYRKKYLATSETRYYTPARFDQETIRKIREQAAKAFKSLKMKGFGRLDGWISKEGEIWFSDVNAISGMEQNSFLFQQPALLGLSHRQLLDYIIEQNIYTTSEDESREDLPIIFGGGTAERQISVMSGTNVWMKLKSSKKYRPIPFFMTSEGKIYHIPQFLCLHHTVEEIEEKILELKDGKLFGEIESWTAQILDELDIQPTVTEEKMFVPSETTIEELANTYSFLFLGLHGGDGENGVIQAKLDTLKIPYNGSGAEASALCMDKYMTGEIIRQKDMPGLKTAKKIILPLDKKPEDIWQELTAKEFHPPLIIKPRGDGCSAGVIRINNADHLKKAMEYFLSDKRYIPEKAIHEGHGQIDLPKEQLSEILIEEFIITDLVLLKELEIEWKERSKMIEVTVGLIGERGAMKAFFPSQSIASQEILSLEEKFMGGTGINLTPPPEEYVKSSAVEETKRHIESAAQLLDLEGYARIDAFMNTETGEVTVIEANTLPALTPSTVIYHQALAEPNPMNPRELLEKIIEIGKKRFQKKIEDDRKPGNIQKAPQIEDIENGALERAE